MTLDPLQRGPRPPQPVQQQDYPGLECEMVPRPDYGLKTYVGSGKLKGKVALITGGDSGIGRAVALAYAREGADLVISYLSEDVDALETQQVVEAEGRQCLLLKGDLVDEEHCQSIIAKTIERFGKLDVLVNNAAFQMSRDSIVEIPTDEFDRTMKTNVYAMFWLCKAATPHLKSGASIINVSSIQADNPTPEILAYAATKAAIQNFTAGLAQMLGKEGVRVNCVAPGPIWTPLIPSTLKPKKVEQFGKDTALGRVGQPSELASAFVWLASAEASYVCGATIAVMGGRIML
jgi:NAD(P)-dependent dehydrogenase (short-subunit alcohol dehydrogenase family)